jgi:hypothetical protein
LDAPPIDRLASEIAEALRLSGLVREKDISELTARLSTGRMREQDWRSVVGQALKQESGSANP